MTGSPVNSKTGDVTDQKFRSFIVWKSLLRSKVGRFYNMTLKLILVNLFKTHLVESSQNHKLDESFDELFLDPFNGMDMIHNQI